MSKNINSASNWSRDAGHHVFKTGNDILVANTNPIGSVSIEQVADNVSFPNVQSAIDDLAALSIFA